MLGAQSSFLPAGPEVNAYRRRSQSSPLDSSTTRQRDGSRPGGGLIASEPSGSPCCRTRGASCAYHERVRAMRVPLPPIWGSGSASWASLRTGCAKRVGGSDLPGVCNSFGVTDRLPRLSRRPAVDDDERWMREVHHAAFREVLERQFGTWDEVQQDGSSAASGLRPASRCGGSRCGYVCIEDRNADVHVRFI